MKVLIGPDYKIEQESIVAFGKFDGVHKGHRKLINTLIEHAKMEDSISIIYTFLLHPKTVISGEMVDLLTSNAEKTKLIEALGVDILIFENFTKEFANMEAEAFVKEVLLKKLRAKKIIMGSNSTFGKNREGNIELMRMLAIKYKFQLIEVELLKDNDKIISSTEIRKIKQRSFV